MKLSTSRLEIRPASRPVVLDGNLADTPPIHHARDLTYGWSSARHPLVQLFWMKWQMRLSSFGLMRTLPKELGDVAAKMQFDDANDNFFAAARHGLTAQLTWVDGSTTQYTISLNNSSLPPAEIG